MAANSDWYSGTSSTAGSTWRYERDIERPPRIERMSLVDEILGEFDGKIKARFVIDEPEEKPEPLLFDPKELYL